MVIERALEKLRQANAASAGQQQAAVSARPAVKKTPLVQPEVALISRPVFARVAVDPQAIELHRVVIPDVHAADDPRAGAAYRMLRTRLLHKLRSNQWKTLAITSPGPGDGKSLTALNLAANVARDKTCDVFLIDLDMRNPSICRYLGARPPRELIEYFTGEGQPSEVFFSIGIDNLAIAGNTTSTDQASELIAGNRLEELLAYISTISANPVVFIDLPPVLVTDEALLVAPRVDATLLVVAEGKTRRDSLARATQVLAEFPLAGVVLNRSSEAVSKEAGYYYGYGYGAAKR